MDSHGEGGLTLVDSKLSKKGITCFQVRSRDPSTGLLVQAGGQTVVEYLTAKNSLIQVDSSCKIANHWCETFDTGS